MTFTPKVTVAVATCCNRARFLQEALQSVLGQTFEDIEVYVSNDGSTDATPSVVASFDDARLHYVPLAQPGGLHANLNHCLRLGSAPYVAICQDDDFWLPENLATLVAVMEREADVGLAHGAFRLVDPEGRVLEDWASWTGLRTSTVEPGAVFIRESMDSVNRVNMSSALIRRAVLGEESFRTDDDVLCDTGMWMRLARRGDVAFVAEPLTALRVHRDNVSVAAGINEPDSRRATLHEIRLAKRVKERFLTESGYSGAELQEHRRASRRWARRELLRIVVRNTAPERSPASTLRLFREAVQVEPSLLRSLRAWRFLVGSLVGRPGRRAAQRLLGPPGPIG